MTLHNKNKCENKLIFIWREWKVIIIWRKRRRRRRRRATELYYMSAVVAPNWAPCHAFPRRRIAGSGQHFGSQNSSLWGTCQRSGRYYAWRYPIGYKFRHNESLIISLGASRKRGEELHCWNCCERYLYFLKSINQII